eukprot:868937-Amphidinium_carterae.2
MCCHTTKKVLSEYHLGPQELVSQLPKNHTNSHKLTNVSSNTQEVVGSWHVFVCKPSATHPHHCFMTTDSSTLCLNAGFASKTN